MRAPSDLRPHVALLLAGIALGACGEGLYDADGIPVLEGGGAACGAGQVLCGGVCETEDASHCGDACEACPQPAAGVAACLRDGASAACGYECTDGLLKCDAGCCGATALAAGDAHTCALLDSGEVSCWGANASGQLGDGSTADRAVPRRVSLPADALAIAAGAAHSCAVLAAPKEGAVYCWGNNDAGQVVGSATGLAIRSPAEVRAITGATRVAGGESHTCALVAGGAVWCWGSNAAGQLGPAQPVPLGAAAVALAAGASHSCALVAGGAVRCWGENGKGQLGGTTANGIATPIPAGIAHLAASADQTCAATGTSGGPDPDDALRCWGDVFDGWGFDAQEVAPTVPLRDPQRAAIEFSVGLLGVGAQHACVRHEPHAVECLGANERGQLGASLLEPDRTVEVPLPATPPAAPLPRAVALAAGSAHTCAAYDDRRMRCWGANGVGQLGDGTTGVYGGVVAPLGR